MSYSLGGSIVPCADILHVRDYWASDIRFGNTAPPPISICEPAGAPPAGGEKARCRLFVVLATKKGDVELSTRSDFPQQAVKLHFRDFCDYDFNLPVPEIFRYVIVA